MRILNSILTLLWISAAEAGPLSRGASKRPRHNVVDVSRSSALSGDLKWPRQFGATNLTTITSTSTSLSSSSVESSETEIPRTTSTTDTTTSLIQTNSEAFGSLPTTLPTGQAAEQPSSATSVDGLSLSRSQPLSTCSGDCQEATTTSTSAPIKPSTIQSTDIQTDRDFPKSSGTRIPSLGTSSVPQLGQNEASQPASSFIVITFVPSATFSMIPPPTDVSEDVSTDVSTTSTEIKSDVTSSSLDAGFTTGETDTITSTSTEPAFSTLSEPLSPSSSEFSLSGVDTTTSTSLIEPVFSTPAASSSSSFGIRSSDTFIASSTASLTDSPTSPSAQESTGTSITSSLFSSETVLSPSSLSSSSPTELVSSSDLSSTSTSITSLVVPTDVPSSSLLSVTDFITSLASSTETAFLPSSSPFPIGATSSALSPSSAFSSSSASSASSALFPSSSLSIDTSSFFDFSSTSSAFSPPSTSSTDSSGFFTVSPTSSAFTPSSSSSAGTSSSLPAFPLSITHYQHTGTVNIDVPTALTSMPTATTRVAAADYAKNADRARYLNAIYANLTVNSACSENQAACIRGSVGRCRPDGSYDIISCPSGTSCYALPMNNTIGVALECVDNATAKSILGTIPNSGESTSNGSSSSTESFSSTTTVTRDGSDITLTVTITETAIDSVPTTTSAPPTRGPGPRVSSIIGEDTTEGERTTSTSTSRAPESSSDTSSFSTRSFASNNVVVVHSKSPSIKTVTVKATITRTVSTGVF